MCTFLNSAPHQTWTLLHVNVLYYSTTPNSTFLELKPRDINHVTPEVCCYHQVRYTRGLRKLSMRCSSRSCYKVNTKICTSCLHCFKHKPTEIKTLTLHIEWTDCIMDRILKKVEVGKFITTALKSILKLVKLQSLDPKCCKMRKI